MGIAKLAWVSVAVALLVAGVAGSGTVQDKTVQITEKGFVPGKVEVIVGQRVVFENATSMDHSVASKAAGDSDQDKEPRFDSGVIKPGARWEHIFSKEGTYDYVCKEDATMTGTIVVSSAK